MRLTQEPQVQSAPLGPAAMPAVADTPEARDELECPLCGYSLRGLGGAAEASTTPETAAEPATWTRCPECGYVCHWKLLLHARHSRQHFLFEHHPRRNVWSYFHTLLAGQRPTRFWSAINAGHQLRPGRLVVYWVVTSLA